MKKFFCIILALSMMLGFAACGGTTTNIPGTLEEIAAQIYTNTTTIEMSLADPMEIDLTNSDTVNYYLGVSSADSIERAVFSEPMIGSIAYSMCLVKAKEGADVEALKNEILEGINYRKWLCVAAEKVAVVNCGDTVMMVMAQEEIVDDVCNSFASVAAVVGATASEPITKAGEAQNDAQADGAEGGIVLG